MKTEGCCESCTSRFEGMVGEMIAGLIAEASASDADAGRNPESDHSNTNLAYAHCYILSELKAWLRGKQPLCLTPVVATVEGPLFRK